MSIADLIRSMSAAGAPSEAIALAVEAVERAELKARSARAHNAERVRRHRERKALQAIENAQGNVTCNATVTPNVTLAPSPSSAPLVPPLPPAPLTPPIIPPPSTPTPDRPLGASARQKPSPGFSEFWAAYPRRIAKAAAEKAWPKACQRAEPAAIIAAAKLFAEHPPDDPQFIPHPATWLNQARFEDETHNGNTARPMVNGAGTQPVYRRNIGLEMLRELRDGIEADAGSQGGDSRTGLALPMPARH